MLRGGRGSMAISKENAHAKQSKIRTQHYVFINI